MQALFLNIIIVTVFILLLFFHIAQPDPVPNSITVQKDLI